MNSSNSFRGNKVFEKETLMDIKKSVIRNFLDTLILVKLKKNRALNGYEMVRYIQKKYDLVISPSTVYSALYHLERRNLIRAESEENVRFYSLTEKGFAVTKIILDHQKKINSYLSMCLFG